MQVLVLAGGLGTRMWPHTATIPKALLPVAGRPFAEHQVELLATNGIDDIVFAIAYRGGMIRRALGDGRRWGVRIRYSDEGQHARGTGGAVRLFAASPLADGVFAVLYGDSYLPIDYHAVWEANRQSGAPALMTVLENRDQWDTSNVAFATDGRLRYRRGVGERGGMPYIGERGGMPYIDYGLSVLSRDVVLERIPLDGVSDLGDLFAELGERGELAGHEVRERFYEIGSKRGIADLDAFLADAGEAAQ